MSEPGERQLLLMMLLDRAEHLMVEELVSRMHQHGYHDLRSADHRVLSNLDSSGTRVIDLARRTQMTHQGMSQLVEGLEARGYLERRLDPGDRRAKIVRLTGKGQTMSRLALREMAEIEGQWLCRLARRLEGDVRDAFEQAIREAETLGDDSDTDCYLSK